MLSHGYRMVSADREYCRVVLTDDRALARESIKQRLAADFSIKVVGEANDARELHNVLSENECDVCVLDLSGTGTRGMDAIRGLNENFPTIRVVILAGRVAPGQLREMNEAENVWGLLYKEDGYDRLADAVKKVRNGFKAFSEKIEEILLEDNASGGLNRVGIGVLTPRELEVMRLAAKGVMNKEIAAKLKISVRTVESHRAKIMTKLMINNFAELVRTAIDHGLL